MDDGPDRPGPPGLYESVFSPRAARRAFVMSGAILASATAGYCAQDVAAILQDGFVALSAAAPFSEPVAMSQDFFDGAMQGFAAFGRELADRARQSGITLPDDVRGALGDMAIHASDHLAALRSGTGAVMSRAGETAFGWKSIVKDAIPDAVRDRVCEIVTSAMNDPMNAAKVVGGYAKNAVEAFGVAKGLQEAWSWTLRRIKTKAEAAPVEPAGLAPAAVTNLNVNIAVSGVEAAEEALDQIRRMLVDPRSTSVMMDRDLLRQTLSQAEDFSSRTELSMSDRIVAMSDETNRELHAKMRKVAKTGVDLPLRDWMPMSRIEGGLITKVIPKKMILDWSDLLANEVHFSGEDRMPERMIPGEDNEYAP